MGSLRALLVAVALFGAPAAAQSSEQAETGRRFERPDEGFERGLWSVPSWVPAAAGIAIFAMAAAGLVLRFAGKKKS
jgi:hypothetical protein